MTEGPETEEPGTEKSGALEERLIKLVNATATFVRGPIVDTFYLAEDGQQRVGARFR
jgi:hypothetical protein